MQTAFFLNAVSTSVAATGLTEIKWHGTRNGNSGDSKIDLHGVHGQTLVVRLNIATQALDGLQIEGLAGPDDTDWLVLASTQADYTVGTASPWVHIASVFTTATGAYVDGNVVTAAAAKSVLLVLRTWGLTALRIKVSAGGNSAVVTGYATGYNQSMSA
jgi:hypothetical protein